MLGPPPRIGPALGAIAALCACQSSPKPIAVGGGSSALTSVAPPPLPAPVAGSDYCRDGAEPPASSAVFGSGQARAPAIVPLGDDWLVGWLDGGRVALSTERAARAGAAPVSPSDAKASWGIALATHETRAAAVWVADEPRRIEARVFDGDGRPASAAVVLSTLSDVGPPTSAASDEGFVALLVEGPELRAARLDRDGRVTATTSWPGGNLRPWSDFSGPPPPGGPPRTRAAPFGFGSPVSLVAAAAGLRAYWWGSHWESDDVSGRRNTSGRSHSPTAERSRRRSTTASRPGRTWRPARPPRPCRRRTIQTAVHGSSRSGLPIGPTRSRPSRASLPDRSSRSSPPRPTASSWPGPPRPTAASRSWRAT